MKHTPRLLATVLFFSLAGCGGSGLERSSDATVSELLSDEVLAASDAIDAPGILESVTYLGGDELEGRGPGTPGDRLTREYLAQRMERLGLEPAFAGGSWDQPFKIIGVDSRMPEDWTFRGDDGEASFRFRDEYMGASGVQ